MKSLLIAMSFLFLISTSSYAQKFSDDFESGNLNKWNIVAGGGMTHSVSTSPAIGTYSLQIDGSGNEHSSGIRANISNADTSIDEVSWMVRTNNTSSASGYVVFLDSNSKIVNNSVFFSYIINGNLRFYVSASTIYEYKVSANQWYKVEIRNINWATRTLDIYIDDVLRRSSFPFRGTLTKADEFRLYNYNGGSGISSNYDNFTVDGDRGPLCVESFSADVTKPTAGQSNGSIDVDCTNGGSPIRYARWSLREGENYINADELDLNQAPEGIYYLTLITMDNCIEYQGPFDLTN